MNKNGNLYKEIQHGLNRPCKNGKKIPVWKGWDDNITCTTDMFLHINMWHTLHMLLHMDNKEFFEGLDNFKDFIEQQQTKNVYDMTAYFDKRYCIHNVASTIFWKKKKKSIQKI